MNQVSRTACEVHCETGATDIIVQKTRNTTGLDKNTMNIFLLLTIGRNSEWSRTCLANECRKENIGVVALRLLSDVCCNLPFPVFVVDDKTMVRNVSIITADKHNSRTDNRKGKATTAAATAAPTMAYKKTTAFVPLPKCLKTKQQLQINILEKAAVLSDVYLKQSQKNSFTEVTQSSFLVLPFLRFFLEDVITIQLFVVEIIVGNVLLGRDIDCVRLMDSCATPVSWGQRPN